MQQIKLMSKLGLALIAVTAISVAVATQAYYTQAADAQPRLPNNSVRSETIVDGQVNTEDLASGAVNPNVHIVEGNQITIAPNQSVDDLIDCPAGEILSGGGFAATSNALVRSNNPLDENTWRVLAENTGEVGDALMKGYALCIGPSP